MSNLHINWQWKKFEALGLREWHDLLRLRINVFVVEQDCPYPELDGKDFEAIHVFGEMDDQIIGVARILPPGVSYSEVSIGRVATDSEFRGRGIGRALMHVCIQAIIAEFGTVPIRISAQTYLKQFYVDLGFTDTGNHYLEDGIPHVEMYLENPSFNTNDSGIRAIHD